MTALESDVIDCATNDVMQEAQTIKPNNQNTRGFLHSGSTSEKMLRMLVETVGKDVLLIGLWSEHPIVTTVNSADINCIHATIKKTGEELLISTAYVIFLLRTTEHSRKRILSRNKGCEFVLRLTCSQRFT